MIEAWRVNETNYPYSSGAQIYMQNYSNIIASSLASDTWIPESPGNEEFHKYLLFFRGYVELRIHEEPMVTYSVKKMKIAHFQRKWLYFRFFEYE
jgi:hypothetical protein